MSFMHTKQQMADRRKWVTRRLGWMFLKPGEIVNAIEQGQGLRKGEKVKRICQIRVVSVQRQTLGDVDQRECNLEGFPEMTPRQFCEFFIKTHPGLARSPWITRIQFEFL